MKPNAYATIAVVGPTASGKSALADELAVRLGTEVLSADAMQVYRGMDIGTAKTPPDERRVTLHGVDLVDPDQAYSAALFAPVAHDVIDRLVSERGSAVVCGGTGLYIRAALECMDFPSGDQTNNPVRDRYTQMAEELGVSAFHALLQERDPQSAALIHPNNVRRVVRAFELLEQGTSYAQEHATLHVKTDRHPTLYIGLTMDRNLLYERINKRVDLMFERGLVNEVTDLVNRGLGDALTSRQAIGYKEVIAYLNGECSLDTAIEDIKRASRRYAKRQMTWFKADERVHWIDPSIQTIDDAAQSVLQLFTLGTCPV